MRREDPELANLVERAAAAAEAAPRVPTGHTAWVLCPRFRFGDQLVQTISVVAQFNVPLDVTLDELRIELIYPTDELARRFFDELAAGVSAR